MYECFDRMYVYTVCAYLVDSEEGFRSSGTGVINSCECGKLNPNPLKAQ